MKKIYMCLTSFLLFSNCFSLDSFSSYSLLNKEVITNYLTKKAIYAGSHGSLEDFLGAGLCYYSLVYMKKAKLCVCLGSGGGFVPRIMRQAQRDLKLINSKTILVDGNMGPYGRPDYLSEDSFFRKNYPEIELVVDTTYNIARNQGKNWKIDYLHIDADHSAEGSLQNFLDYISLMSPDGIITLHDTSPKDSPYRALETIQKMGYEVVNFPNIGAGFAIISTKKTIGN